MAAPPVTFPCPFCTRRMGVPEELLGRQVRCPHCKRVVVAPTTAGTAPVAPTPISHAPPSPEPELREFNVPQQREGADSILSEPGESDDEVFVSPSNTPTRTIPPLELLPQAPEPAPSASSSDDPFGFSLRPEPSVPSQSQIPHTLVTGTIFNPPTSQPPAPTQSEAKSEQSNPFSDPESGAESEAPNTVAPSTPPHVDSNPFTGFESDPLPPPAAKPTKSSEPPVPNETPSAAPPNKQPEREEAPAVTEEKPPLTARPRPAPSGGGKTVVLVLLAGYAIVATAVAIYGLFFRSGGVPETGHPLSTIPDTFGEFDPVSRKKVTKLNFPVDGELPAAQRTGLGGKITIGQLDVEPIRVQKRPLRMLLEGADERDKQTVRAGTALVLTLAISNRSSDLPIFPMDPAFIRRATKDDQPITRLVVGHKVFAGGEIEWPLPGRFKKKIEVQQGNDAKVLEPRRSQEYIVFTEANPELINVAESTKEPLQWRIQVRSGLIEYKGKEVPVTAVIGVDFKASDIRGMD